jgi:prevent-host-death family protein
MATVGTRELKNRLSHYLRLVQSGATVVVTDHGKPVAELRPVANGSPAREQRWARLAALGVVTLPKRKKSGRFRPMRLRGGRPLSRDIIEDRG